VSEEVTVSETKTIELVYAGKRLDGRGALCDARFRPSDPETVLLFKRVRGGVVGGVYEAEVSEADASLTIHGQPTWTKERSEEAGSLQAADAAAKAEHEAASAEKKAGEDSELRKLLLPVRRFVQRQPRSTSRWALVQAIAAEINRPLTKAEREG
jgi:hypothetical protein